MYLEQIVYSSISSHLTSLNVLCNEQHGAVSLGVPQGSILGILLFAFFINDLSVVIKYSLLDLYADDAEMHCS